MRGLQSPPCSNAVTPGKCENGCAPQEEGGGEPPLPPPPSPLQTKVTIEGNGICR